MSNYRVTIMVTLDVEAEMESEAMSRAIIQVRERIGDDGVTTLADRVDPMWVTGIAQDPSGEYYCYGMVNK
jgi:hypothetical protein